MGGIKCQTIVNIIDELAPRRLAMDWDNVGLLIGDGSQTVNKVLICLDALDWVIDEAIEEKAGLIISHHPMIFGGIKKINTDSILGKKIIKLIKHDISLYALHTNYDMAAGGLNDILAKNMGFENFTLLEHVHTEKLYKFVVFVPSGHEQKIIDAICSAGAGHIGKYSSTTFRAQGLGTFKPEEGSRPFIGNQGKLEEVKELRIETVVPQRSLQKVIREMLKSHPYEEPAYDIFELQNPGNELGFGRLGIMAEEIQLKEYVNIVKRNLNLNTVRIAGDMEKNIKKVVLLNGSGSKFISAAKFAGADAIITGDVQYHEMVDAAEMGLAVIDAGHYGTEKIMINAVSEFLECRFAELRYDVAVVRSKTNTDPIKII